MRRHQISLKLPQSAVDWLRETATMNDQSQADLILSSFLALDTLLSWPDDASTIIRVLRTQYPCWQGYSGESINE